MFSWYILVSEMFSWYILVSTRTGDCEWLPSDHPTTTSTWCVWTPVHAGVVTICSDQPVHDRWVVFDLVTRWKEGFVNMINRNFMRLLMMGVFSRVCSGVLGGMRESVVSDSGRRHWFFFWVGGIGNGKRRYHGPWSSSYVHCMSHGRNVHSVHTVGFGNSTCLLLHVVRLLLNR